jgi:hypothetical protein
LQGDKKRKRPAAKTQDQLAALEALYTSDRYPSTETKRECGIKVGIDLKEVNRWFEGRRRKDTRASKRSKSDAADPPAEAVPAADAAGPAQEQATTKEEAELAVISDIEMVDGTAPTQGPTPALAVESAIVTVPEKMTAAPPVSTAPKTTPASSTLPDIKGIATLIEELSSEADTLRQRGLAAPLTTIPSAASGTTPEPFTDARLAAFIVGQQMPLAKLTAILHPLFGPPEGAAEGTVLTVEALRTRIVDLAVRRSHDPLDNPKGAPPRLDALEAMPKEGKPSMWQWELRDPKILPKAQYKATMGIKRRAGRVGDRLAAIINAHDALVKVTVGLLTHTKASKIVDALKKYDTLERLKAVEAEEQAAAAAKEAEKAGKAALTIEQKQRAAAEKEAEKKRAAEEKEVERKRVLAEKEAEKELLRLEKVAEKERLRQEKEAEKEQAKKEREAEKEKKLKEAEAAKLAKKTGFKDTKVLHKTAKNFMNFFIPGTGAGPSAANGKASSVSPTETAAPSPARAAVSNAPGSAAGGGTAAAFAKTTTTLSAYERRFPRPPPDNLVPQPVQPLSIAKIDAALSAAPIPYETAEEEWKASLASAATARRAAASAPPSGIGLPPSWARRPGAVEAAADRLRKMKETGADLSRVHTWRRKLIWFSGDSMRPPYYGSWPQPGPAINARRYLGKDETLDYEVMSDLDWEEEPEGSSLSGADDEDDGPGEESEVEDSFMVADGYLSEDEGVRLDDDMDVDSGEVEEQMRLLNAATAAAAAAAAAGGGESDNAVTAAGATMEVRTRASQAMHVLLDRARRAGKPLVVVRPHVADAKAPTNTDASGPDGCVVTGDPAALEALAMEVLIPGVSFIPPQDPALANENTNAFGANGAAGGVTNPKRAGAGGVGAGAGRPKAECPDELLPELASFIMQNTSVLKSALINAFIAAHPERKMTKKWVGEKITQLAERSGNSWTLRAVPATINGGGSETTPAPARTAAAATTGALERLLGNARPGAGTTSKPTPAVPSALRPAFPASNLKAPERLVTTTAAGEAHAQAHVDAAAAASAVAVQQPLIIPEAVDGTGDDFWTLLLQHIEAETCIPTDGASMNEPSFMPAFQHGTLARVIHALPAFIVDALLMTVHRNCNSNGEVGCIGKKRVAAAAVRSLRATVDALDHLERRCAFGEDATSSQKAWGEARSGSHCASLAGLCREPALFEVLKNCISGSLGARAEEDAVAMVGVLGGCPASTEISAENAAVVRSSLDKAGRGMDVLAWDANFQK